MNSLLLGAVDWITQHKYSFCTNEEGGQIKLNAKFSSLKVEHATYDLSIAANQTDEFLTFTISSPEALKLVPDSAVPIVLAIFNSRREWGHYTVKPDERALCFKITLLNSISGATARQFDRLLDEALNGMDSGLSGLVLFKQIEEEDTIETPSVKSDPTTAIHDVLNFEEGDAWRGVGRNVQSPVHGENLAGFLQLAGHDEGEHQIVALVQ